MSDNKQVHVSITGGPQQPTDAPHVRVWSTAPPTASGHALREDPEWIEIAVEIDRPALSSRGWDPGTCRARVQWYDLGNAWTCTLALSLEMTRSARGRNGELLVVVSTPDCRYPALISPSMSTSEGNGRSSCAETITLLNASEPLDPLKLRVSVTAVDAFEGDNLPLVLTPHDVQFEQPVKLAYGNCAIGLVIDEIAMYRDPDEVSRHFLMYARGRLALDAGASVGHRDLYVPDICYELRDTTGFMLASRKCTVELIVDPKNRSGARDSAVDLADIDNVTWCVTDTLHVCDLPGQADRATSWLEPGAEY